MERLRHVELQHGDAAQQDAGGGAGAHHRHTLDGVAVEADLGRLSLRPGGAGVEEEGEVGRQERGLDQAVALHAQQRHPQLQVGHRETAPQQAVELGAGGGVARHGRTLRQADVAELIAVHQGGIAHVEGG